MLPCGDQRRGGWTRYTIDASIGWGQQGLGNMEDGTSVAVIVGAIILGLFLLGLAIGLAIGAFGFAVFLFFCAREQGFVGVALYIILWVIADRKSTRLNSRHYCAPR